MTEQEIEIKVKQIAQDITQAKCFNQAEQKVLSDFLAENGSGDDFFQKAKEMLEIVIENATKKINSILVDFDEQTETAEQETAGQRAAFVNNLQGKLSQVADDDFAGKTKIMEEYNQEILAQYENLEQQIREIGAKAMIEATYPNADNQQN